MKNSSRVIIFLGIVLWAEFVGATVYRSLVNNNYSRKEEGSLEKTRNGIEDKIDVARARNGMIENVDGGHGVGEDYEWVQEGTGQMGSGEKFEEEVGVGGDIRKDNLDNARSNVPVVREGKGPCTCGEQIEMDREAEQGESGGNNGQGTQSENDGLDGGTEGNLGQGGIEDEAADGKEESEMMEAGRRVEEPEDTNDGSGEKGDMDEEVGSEKSKRIENEEQDQTNTDVNNGFDIGVQTLRFSPLDR